MKALPNNRSTAKRRITAVTLALGTSLVLLCSGALAQNQQQDGGPPPGFSGGGFGNGGPGNGGPGGGGGHRMQQRTVTLVNIPLGAMTAYLGLDDTQQQKVNAIQGDVSKALLAARPKPPQQAFGNNDASTIAVRNNDTQQRQQQPPLPLSPEEMDVARRTRDDIEKQGSTRIKAVLTDTQKAQTPTLLKAITALQTIGRIPPPMIDQLNLTGAQIESLAAIPAKSRRSAVITILTDDQEKIVHDSRTQQGGFNGGGPGGPGGPPQF